MRAATITSGRICAAPIRAALLAAALALPLASLAAPARATILISIDKTTQHMSVVVDGAPRYIWPVSTGRSGYDTPSGTFKPNRMDADHFSQEWDNAPMPHTIFFDMAGHAIHGFFDVKHLGLAVSHGCVRLSPDHAATLYELIKAEGMGNTSVVISGQTPSGRGPAMARQVAPVEPVAGDPTPLLPADYGQQPAPYDGRPAYGQPAYGRPAYGQPAYGQPGPPTYGQRTYGQSTYGQPYYGQPQPYYAQPSYGQPVYRQW